MNHILQSLHQLTIVKIVKAIILSALLYQEASCHYYMTYVLVSSDKSYHIILLYTF